MHIHHLDDYGVRVSVELFLFLLSFASDPCKSMNRNLGIGNNEWGPQRCSSEFASGKAPLGFSVFQQTIRRGAEIDLSIG